MYSSISPPTKFLILAKTSLATFLALTVDPLAIPKISEISLDGIVSVVLIIIFLFSKLIII